MTISAVAFSCGSFFPTLKISHRASPYLNLLPLQYLEKQSVMLRNESNCRVINLILCIFASEQVNILVV